MVPQNCHPDRSAAQWRDLRFPIPSRKNEFLRGRLSCPVRKRPIRTDVVASVAIWIAFQIVLMFGLRLPKRTRRLYLRHDFSRPNARGIDVRDGVFCDTFLLVGRIKDRGAITGSTVVSLPIQCGWIVNLKEELQQLAVAQLLRVKDDLYGLGMGAMIAIGGVGNIPAAVSDARRDYTRVAAQQVLHAPKAATG